MVSKTKTMKQIQGIKDTIKTLEKQVEALENLPT